VCFVDQQHDGLAAFVVLGGQQLGGLGDQGRPVEAGDGPEGAHEVVVDASGADHGVGQVDDRVAGRVEAGGHGTGGDGLAGADFAGDHADGVLVDQPAQPGDGFLVAAGGEQLTGGEVATERLAGEAVVGAEPVDGHGATPAS
jgi:hypothetical protein